MKKVTPTSYQLLDGSFVPAVEITEAIGGSDCLRIFQKEFTPETRKIFATQEDADRFASINLR